MRRSESQMSKGRLALGARPWESPPKTSRRGPCACTRTERLGGILDPRRSPSSCATRPIVYPPALVRGLKLAVEYTTGTVELTCDSELAVRQLTGRYRVRQPNLAELLLEVRAAERGFARGGYRHAPPLAGPPR